VSTINICTYLQWFKKLNILVDPWQTVQDHLLRLRHIARMPLNSCVY